MSLNLRDICLSTENLACVTSLSLSLPQKITLCCHDEDVDTIWILRGGLSQTFVIAPSLELYDTVSLFLQPNPNPN